jgi:hypothetical protein
MASCCMLHVACCMLHVACCMLQVACCMLHVACCIGRDEDEMTNWGVDHRRKKEREEIIWYPRCTRGQRWHFAHIFGSYLSFPERGHPGDDVATIQASSSNILLFIVTLLFSLSLSPRRPSTHLLVVSGLPEGSLDPRTIHRARSCEQPADSRNSSAQTLYPRFRNPSG